MTDAEDIVRAFVAKVNERDLDGLVELMTDDHVFVDSEGTVQRGREAMRGAWRSYFDSFPEYRIQVDKVVKLGNTVVLIGATTGSHIPLEVEALATVIWCAVVEGRSVREWHVLYTDTEKARRLLAVRESPTNEEGSSGPP